MAPLRFGHWPEEGGGSSRARGHPAAAAALLGCDAEELALTRSATEALQIVQLGLQLRAGDEVLVRMKDIGRCGTRGSSAFSAMALFIP